AVPLTIVLVNNGGGGIFAFLPIAKHQDVMLPCFHEPHTTDFAAACYAFGIPHVLCKTPEEFEAAYLQTQGRRASAGACVIEARPALSYEENVVFHNDLGQAVAERTRKELLAKVSLSWTHTTGSSLRVSREAAAEEPPLVLLHGWMGEKADWAEVSRLLVEEHGRSVLSVDLPGHGESKAASGGLDSWEASALFSLPMAVEVLSELLSSLQIKRAVLVGYSLGGRVAMAFAHRYPDRSLGVIALSANPGPRSACERFQRWQQDVQLAGRLREINNAKDYEAFLAKWYAAPLWGGLADRRPAVYKGMLRRRRRSCAKQASHALTG
ncbi:unnamed protein product, partial [Polarella glacialis]